MRATRDPLTSHCCARAPGSGCKGLGSGCETETGLVCDSTQKRLVLLSCERRAGNHTIPAPAPGDAHVQLWWGRESGPFTGRLWTLSDFGTCCSRSVLQKGPASCFGIPAANCPSSCTYYGTHGLSGLPDHSQTTYKVGKRNSSCPRP